MRLDIEVRQVENGYVVREGDKSNQYPSKMWVAKTIFDLQELICKLANECLPRPEKEDSKV